MSPDASSRGALCGDAAFFLRCAWRQVVQALVYSGVSSMIPPRDLRPAADAMAAPPVWWRREARAGIAAVDAYLSQSARISAASY